MNSKKEVQHVYLVGAKSLGAYGGYETFVYKLTEYHQNKENIKYHVACKANGDGCMDESKFDGVTKINEHEFELHNAQPGDLIFFEKTYNTVGASHVGIYVGNGMMIHCGDPISYTSINSTYWQSHFLGFGRIN